MATHWKAYLTRNSDSVVTHGPVILTDAEFQVWHADVITRPPWSDTENYTETVEDYSAQFAQEQADAAQQAQDALDRANRGLELRGKPVLTPQENKEAIDILITELFG